MPMVRWFSPTVLFKTLKKVFPSTLFGKYADGRLVHAALDAIAPDSIIDTCCGGETGVSGVKPGEPIWLDYVADLGDGFDSTYAIAYMIGQKELQVEGQTLPRANCLIMGGDEVYPDASRDDYRKRMQRPYRAAFPITDRVGAKHPPVYLIPGNHDWYDGLNLFSAIFCSGHDTPLGSWVSPQRRSYFATHLGSNWWIWGFDSQLDEDVDGPQSEYFDSIAKAMKPNANVILCASIPTWLAANLASSDDSGRQRFYRGVHFVASKLHDHCEGAKIPLLISGDTHHYNRYVASGKGTNFITAGGGGAFLHPTHEIIADSFDLKWMRGEETKLEIGLDGRDATKKAVYPPPDESRRLALGNLRFWYKNADFSVFLGALYWLFGLLMMAWSGYSLTEKVGNFSDRFWPQVIDLLATPIFVLIALPLVLLVVRSADKKSRAIKFLIAPLHALAQVAVMLFGAAAVTVSMTYIRWSSNGRIKDIPYFLLLLIGMLAVGFVGGAVWGLYLTIVSFCWGAESNNAFCAMRLNSYKHFLRMKIDGDVLTIHPIGIDSVPDRTDWEMNQECEDENQDTPVIVPKNNPRNIGQHFIEAPIVIDMREVQPLKTAV